MIGVGHSLTMRQHTEQQAFLAAVAEQLGSALDAKEASIATELQASDWEPNKVAELLAGMRANRERLAARSYGYGERACLECGAQGGSHRSDCGAVS